ncbi:sulfotransferase [Nonomuraea sp. PA05]|uniref:sulfotransferase family protein n=1 Tax=Nonomuraea sp. PA05 TaxID=2604466 RepID=UPI0011D8E294|nr:sulfotransferase [Nonomuraea sp. PA05]TYB50765.1 sulfotransferase [Nonomuraea sp. PA05]
MTGSPSWPVWGGRTAGDVPEVATWVRAVNTVASAAGLGRPRAGHGSLVPLERAARRRTGIDLPVEDGFRAGMARLLRSYMAVPELTPVGRMAVRDDITRRLTNWLRVHDGPAPGPAPADPVFVVGLPRSGTTLLHRLLAAAPGMRCLPFWELLTPDPRLATARRIRTARMTVTLMNVMAPAAQAVHPLHAREAEECVFLTPHTPFHHTRARIPGYHRWYVTQHDKREDYRHLALHLRRLNGRHRWVLKSPFHLWALDDLLAVFPGATLVWIHRRPSAAIASWCRWMEVTLSLHNRAVDRHQIGADWLGMWREAMTAALRARARSEAPGRFIDVSYQALAADPRATARQVLALLGQGPLPLDLGRSVTRRGGPARPPERYGLTGPAIDRLFADYVSTFADRLDAEDAPR